MLPLTSSHTTLCTDVQFFIGTKCPKSVPKKHPGHKKSPKKVQKGRVKKASRELELQLSTMYKHCCAISHMLDHYSVTIIDTITSCFAGFAVFTVSEKKLKDAKFSPDFCEYAAFILSLLSHYFSLHFLILGVFRFPLEQFNIAYGSVIFQNIHIPSSLFNIFQNMGISGERLTAALHAIQRYIYFTKLVNIKKLIPIRNLRQAGKQLARTKRIYEDQRHLLVVPGCT